MVNKTKKQQTSLTESEINAWCEWRKWCNLFRVKTPLPSAAELAAGKSDDLSPEIRAEYFRLLSLRICNAIHKKLNYHYEIDDLNLSKASLSQSEKGEKSEKEQILNQACCIFDDYMNGEKPEKPESFTGTTYKDYIFHLIASGENFSTIINGKIFSHQAGYILAIAKKYIIDNFLVERGPLGGISYWDEETQKHVPGIRYNHSIDAILNDDSELSLKDKLATEVLTDTISERFDFFELSRAFSLEEKIIIIANAYDLSASNKIVLAALKCEKSKACKLQRELFPPLCGQFFAPANVKLHPNSLYAKIVTMGFEDDFIVDPRASMSKLKNAILADLAAEKRLHSFLYALKDNVSNEEEEE